MKHHRFGGDCTMAAKKVVIKINDDTYYDKYSEKLKIGEVLTPVMCGLCGRVISVGELSWEKQTGGDNDWVSYHENCVKVTSLRNAINCVGHILETLGEL